MKNITVTVDDELHRRARMRAAEQATTVTSVVRDFLEGYCRGETEYDRRKQLECETLNRIKHFSAAERLSREDVHDRHALR